MCCGGGEDLPDRRESLAQLIYDARENAGLTQKQQVIARLEDADYEGHSLSMLRRIGKALKLNLEIRFVRAK